MVNAFQVTFLAVRADIAVATFQTTQMSGFVKYYKYVAINYANFRKDIPYICRFQK